MQESQGHLEHVLAEHRHPGGAVRLLQPPAGGQGGAAVEHADVVQAEEAALEHVVAGGILAVHPPGEVQQQPREALLQERQVHLAEVGLQILQEQSREGVHRGVHVAEIPLVGGHLAARVQVFPGQHQVDLAFREVRVDHGERNAVERQVPGGVPRVLPLVGHGHDVVVEHVEPRLVAAPPPGRRSQRVEVALTQPAVHVEVIALLGPQHPRQGLAHDRLRVIGHRRRRDGLVELVRLGPPPRDQLVRAGERRRERLRALPGEPHQHRGLPASRHDQPDVRRHLGPLAVGIHGVRAVQEVVADAVLGEARRGLGAEYPRHVRFVLTEQQGRFRLGVEVENAEPYGARPGRPDVPTRRERAGAWAHRLPMTTCCGTTAWAARAARRPADERLCTVMRHRMSSGPALACSTSTSK